MIFFFQIRQRSNDAISFLENLIHHNASELMVPAKDCFLEQLKVGLFFVVNVSFFTFFFLNVKCVLQQTLFFNFFRSVFWFRVETSVK